MKYKRSAGILVHPSSLPSPYGIGDFHDGAYQLIDFLHEAGLKVWQILPLTPISFGNSPYQGFSSFAGNYLLISPDILVNKGLLDKADLEEKPNFNPYITEYDKVTAYKDKIFKKAYENFKTTSPKDFKAFKKENAHWLKDYALFMAIKKHFTEKRSLSAEIADFYEFRERLAQYMAADLIAEAYFGASFISWPESLRKRDEKALNEIEDVLKDAIEYENFLQYEFYSQWSALKSYAGSKNVEIIGDAPIFVSLDSADVWANPELFLLDEERRPKSVAGVPPDYFSETGQLWGNPLYDWKNHKKQGYAWWIERFRHYFKLYDRVRIDHFRGFAEYWAIPFGEKTAAGGKWVKGPGIKFFKEMEKSLGALPVIAEDLGIITEDVHEMREKLGYPGMAVLQFAFETTSENPYLPHNITTDHLIVYTGTHDNNTTKGWYENAPEKSKDYFRRYLNVSGENASWDMIRLAYALPAVIAICPIQDLLALSERERMNTPGEKEGNWTFRYRNDMLTEDIKNRLLYLNTLFGR